MCDRMDPALHSLGEAIGAQSFISFVTTKEKDVDMFTWRLGKVQNYSGGIRCVYDAVPEKENDSFFGVIFQTGGEVVFTKPFVHFFVVCVLAFLRHARGSGRRTLDLDTIDASMNVAEAMRQLLADSVAEHLHLQIWVFFINFMPKFWTEMCVLWAHASACFVHDVRCLLTSSSDTADAVLVKMVSEATTARSSSDSDRRWFAFIAILRDAWARKCQTLSMDESNVFEEALSLLLSIPRDTLTVTLTHTSPFINGTQNNLKFFTTLCIRAVSAFQPIALYLIGQVSTHLLENIAVDGLRPMHEIFGRLVGGDIYGLCHFFSKQAARHDTVIR